MNKFFIIIVFFVFITSLACDDDEFKKQDSRFQLDSYNISSAGNILKIQQSDPDKVIKDLSQAESDADEGEFIVDDNGKIVDNSNPENPTILPGIFATTQQAPSPSPETSGTTTNKLQTIKLKLLAINTLTSRQMSGYSKPSVKIYFLLDLSGSMRAEIAAVKNNIDYIRNKIEQGNKYQAFFIYSGFYDHQTVTLSGPEDAQLTHHRYKSHEASHQALFEAFNKINTSDDFSIIILITDDLDFQYLNLDNTTRPDLWGGCAGFSYRHNPQYSAQEIRNKIISPPIKDLIEQEKLKIILHSQINHWPDNSSDYRLLNGSRFDHGCHNVIENFFGGAQSGVKSPNLDNTNSNPLADYVSIKFKQKPHPYAPSAFQYSYKYHTKPKEYYEDNIFLHSETRDLLNANNRYSFHQIDKQNPDQFYVSLLEKTIKPIFENMVKTCYLVEAKLTFVLDNGSDEIFSYDRSKIIAGSTNPKSSLLDPQFFLKLIETNDLSAVDSSGISTIKVLRSQSANKAIKAKLKYKYWCYNNTNASMTWVGFLQKASSNECNSSNSCSIEENTFPEIAIEDPEDS